MSQAAPISPSLPPSDDRGGATERYHDWAALLALALLFGVMLVATWQRWTHPIVDHGREMNVPLRLLDGERLYLDITYHYGPFAAHVNALLYRGFGVHLSTLHAAGLVCAVVILLMTYWLARRVLSPWEAALSTALVMITCALSAAMGSYVQPYAYAAVYGWTFVLAALVCSARYVTSRRKTSMWWAGVWIGATVTCKPELGGLASAPLGVAWLLASLSERRWLWRPLGLAAVPALAIALIAYAPLMVTGAAQMLFTETYQLFRQPQMVFFAQVMNGMLAWPKSGWAVVASLGMSLVACGVAALLGLLLDQGLRSLVRQPAWASWLCLAAGGVLWWGAGDVSPLEVSPFRSAPVVIGATIAVLAWRLWRQYLRRDPLSHPDQLALVIAVFGFIAIGRVMLNLSLWSPYAPFTAAPVLLVFCYVFFRGAPAVLLASARGRGYARVIAMLLIAMWIPPLAMQHAELARFNNFELTAPRGRLWTDAALGRPLADAIRFTTAHTQPGDYVLSLPQGSIVHFLADRRNPLREDIIVPGFLTPEREADAIRRAEARGVKLILLSNHPTPEYRDAAFGIHYNKAFMQWIEQHYHPVATFRAFPEGPEPQFGDYEFFIRAYERNVN